MTAEYQDLDKFFKVNPDVLTNNRRNYDLDSTIRGDPTVIRCDQSQDLDNLIKVNPSALRNRKGGQDLESLTEVNSHVSGDKNGRRIDAKPMDSLTVYERSPQEPLSILMKPKPASSPVLEPGMLGPRTLLFIQGHM